MYVCHTDIHWSVCLSEAIFSPFLGGVATESVALLPRIDLSLGGADAVLVWLPRPPAKSCREGYCQQVAERKQQGWQKCAALPHYCEFWQHINWKPRLRPTGFALFCFSWELKTVIYSSICLVLYVPQWAPLIMKSLLAPTLVTKQGSLVGA